MTREKNGKAEPKDGAPITEKPVKEAIETANINSEIDSLLSGYTEELQVTDNSESDQESTIEIPAKKPRTRRKKEQAVISGEILSGAMFLFLIDMIFPAAVCFVNNKFSKTKIKPEKLQLSAKEKKELEPLAEEVAKQLQMKGDPVWMFVITLIGLYGFKLMEIRTQTE